PAGPDLVRDRARRVVPRGPGGEAARRRTAADRSLLPVAAPRDAPAAGMTDLSTWAAIFTALGIGQLLKSLFALVTNRGGAKAQLHQTEATTEQTVVTTATT